MTYHKIYIYDLYDHHELCGCVPSDGVKDPKPRNPRGTTPNFKTPTRTRPRPQKAEPETTPTLDFNYKTPKSKGDVPELLIPEPDPTPTFAPQLHHHMYILEFGAY